MDPSANQAVVTAEQSTFELVKPAYELVRRNLKAFLFVSVPTILSAALSVSGQFGTELGPEQVQGSFAEFSIPPVETLLVLLVLGILVAFVVVLVGAFFQAMSASLQVRVAAGEQPSTSSLVQDGKKYTWRMVVMGLVAGLIVLVGLILLIVPGIIAIMRLMFAPYHLVDKDLSVREALKASNEQAKQNSKEVWKVLGVLSVLGLAAGLVEAAIPIIGVLLSSAVFIVIGVVPVLRYQQLKLPNYPAASGSELPEHNQPIA